MFSDVGSRYYKDILMLWTNKKYTVCIYGIFWTGTMDVDKNYDEDDCSGNKECPYIPSCFPFKSPCRNCVSAEVLMIFFCVSRTVCRVCLEKIHVDDLDGYSNERDFNNVSICKQRANVHWN